MIFCVHKSTLNEFLRFSADHLLMAGCEFKIGGNLKVVANSCGWTNVLRNQGSMIYQNITAAAFN